MQIFGFGQIHQAHAVRPTQRFEAAQETKALSQFGPDQVEFSSAAQEASVSAEASPVREGKIASIRAEIAAGTYDTDEKLELALMRMFGDLE